MLKLCLIGKDISNSRSPELYKGFAKKDNISLSYDIVNLKENKIEDFINLVKSRFYNGFNVTAPYKKTIIKYLDWISDDAQSVDAVNTVYNDNGILKGYNTDIYGAFKSIKPVLQNGNILVLGRGGAARAVVRAFINWDITIFQRNEKNKEILRIKDDLKFINSFNNISFTNVINATNIGFNSEETLLKTPIEGQKVAIDLIYTPPKTKFLEIMEEKGLVIKNGFDMLKFQAEKSYKIYLGEKY